MLTHLTIQNFVIVERIELSLEPGFTVLTGETGAGKSILIDALMLALGGKSDTNQIRQGCERAEIIAEFNIEHLPDTQRWLQENDLADDSGSCILRRVIEANGRSRHFINGISVALQQLRAIGDQLVDIHGQHAHQSLLRSDAQRALLDGFAGNDALLSQVKAAYQHWHGLNQQRLAWEANQSAFAQEKEQLAWQVDELTSLNFNPQEWQSLQADHQRLSHSASLQAAVEYSIDQLSEGEAALLGQLQTTLTRLRQALDYDEKLQSPYQLLESTSVQLQEGIHELKHYQKRLDSDPQRLQDVEERIAAIHAMARKYRCDIESLPERLQLAHDRLQVICGEYSGDNLIEAEASARQHYEAVAQQLTLSRAGAAQSLAKQVTQNMQNLAMAGGIFVINLIPVEQGNANGFEQIEFQVSPHKDTPARPLTKVASGGELSRISLAIQVITSKVSRVPTLIFDEVDAGIGGRIAEMVGTLLKQLGSAHQILCITHLPQVAAMGDQHWLITKIKDAKHAQGISSHIDDLDQQARVEEIARMLGGATITTITRQHAAEMLQKCQNT